MINLRGVMTAKEGKTRFIKHTSGVRNG